MKKVTRKKEKESEVFFKCDCGCGQQLLIVDFEEGRVEINVREDRRR